MMSASPRACDTPHGRHITQSLGQVFPCHGLSQARHGNGLGTARPPLCRRLEARALRSWGKARWQRAPHAARGRAAHVTRHTSKAPRLSDVTPDRQRHVSRSDAICAAARQALFPRLNLFSWALIAFMSLIAFIAFTAFSAFIASKPHLAAHVVEALAVHPAGRAEGHRVHTWRGLLGPGLNKEGPPPHMSRLRSPGSGDSTPMKRQSHVVHLHRGEWVKWGDRGEWVNG
jgi:hypothetical protein